MVLRWFVYHKQLRMAPVREFHRSGTQYRLDIDTGERIPMPALTPDQVLQEVAAYDRSDMYYVEEVHDMVTPPKMPEPEPPREPIQYVSLEKRLAEIPFFMVPLTHMSTAELERSLEAQREQKRRKREQAETDE